MQADDTKYTNFFYIWAHPELKDLRVADNSDMPRLGEPVLSSITLLKKY